MVTMDAFASAFGFDAKSDDVWTTLGKVTAVGSGTLSVLLGGSATPTECEAYCLASVGDIVFVAITKGRARAIACKGVDAATWRTALGLGSMATEDSSDYLPVSGGTLTGSLTINTSSVTIGNPKLWINALGIGTRKQTDISTNVSIPTSSYRSIGSISLEAGTWVVTYGFQYGSSSSGLRSTFMYTSSNVTASNDWYRATCIQTPAASGGSTYHHGSFIVNPSATTTYYLSGWQNSGSSLNCTGNITAVKVG